MPYVSVGRAGPWYFLNQEAAVSNSFHNSFDASTGVENLGETWRHSLLMKERGSAHCALQGLVQGAVSRCLSDPL